MPTTLNRAISLNFRDSLRREYDVALRTVFVRLSRHFDQLPSRAWNELRRDPASAARPWGTFLVLIDDAIRAGAYEDEVREIPAILEAYIATRCSMRELTPVGARVAVPESMRRAA